MIDLKKWYKKTYKWCAKCSLDPLKKVILSLWTDPTKVIHFLVLMYHNSVFRKAICSTCVSNIFFLVIIIKKKIRVKYIFAHVLYDLYFLPSQFHFLSNLVPVVYEKMEIVPPSDF
jgi:hypothetical protein